MQCSFNTLGKSNVALTFFRITSLACPFQRTWLVEVAVLRRHPDPPLLLPNAALQQVPVRAAPLIVQAAVGGTAVHVHGDDDDAIGR